MTLNELPGISPTENASVEFKARLNREDTEGWLKTVAGFLNVSGGTLYVGVEGRSGKLPGFTEAEAEGESEPGKRIIVYCVGKARNAGEIAGHLGISNSTYLRQTLRSLEEKGYISSVKKGRTRYCSTQVRALG